MENYKFQIKQKIFKVDLVLLIFSPGVFLLTVTLEKSFCMLINRHYITYQINHSIVCLEMLLPNKVGTRERLFQSCISCHPPFSFHYQLLITWQLYACKVVCCPVICSHDWMPKSLHLLLLLSVIFVCVVVVQCLLGNLNISLVAQPWCTGTRRK